MVARSWLPVFCLTAMLGAAPAAADTNILSGRFNPSGTPDADFGNEVGAPGLVSTDLGAVAAGAAIVAQTIAGTDFVVVAGSSGDDFALLHLGLDGSPDLNFGTNGVVITDLGGVDRASAVAIQTIGGIDYIVVAGNSDGDLAVVRYNADGTPDITFGLGDTGDHRSGAQRHGHGDGPADDHGHLPHRRGGQQQQRRRAGAL